MRYHMRMSAVVLVGNFGGYRTYLENYRKQKDDIYNSEEGSRLGIYTKTYT